MTKRQLTRGIGLVGALAFAAVYVKEPSFPTADKILVFLTLVFMALGQGWEFFKRLAPFVGLLLVYESFRGLADHLNSHVNYQFMITVDRWIGLGQLPTERLQHLLWRGSAHWWDFMAYFFYMLHFVLPFALALLIWKKRESYYWRYITTFVVVSFAGFLTYLAFPAAPPWLASDKGLIAPIAHVSSYVWQAAGLHDFPSVYNKISPNAVAAMPSLHAAYATLIAIFTIKLFRSRWRWLILLHPFMIYFGTVYTGEHYVIDELAGIAYGVAAYFAAPWVLQKTKMGFAVIKHKMERS